MYWTYISRTSQQCAIQNLETRFRPDLDQLPKTFQATINKINKYDNTKAKSYKQILEKLSHTTMAIACLSKHTPCWVRMILHRHTLVLTLKTTNFTALYWEWLLRHLPWAGHLQYTYCSFSTTSQQCCADLFSSLLPNKGRSHPSFIWQEGTDWIWTETRLFADLHYSQGQPAVVQNHLSNVKRSKRPFNLKFCNWRIWKQISLTWNFMAGQFI